MLTKAINSSLERLRIVNDSLPRILDSISPFKNLAGKEEKVEGLVKISYTPKIESISKEEKVSVTIVEKDKEKFLKELTISRETLNRLKRESKVKGTDFIELRKANFYAKISNKLFLSFSTDFSNKGRLKKLNSYLRRANMPFLVTTYFSMAIFSTLLALAAALVIFVFLLFFTITTTFPFFSSHSPSFLGILINFLIVILIPIITFVFFYFYPYLEGKSVEGKINQELPFVAIHMSAVAGSGIEPTQIFKIIAFGEEYPATKKELKKIINQVNVYGYDLITALKNTARETSSRKLSELLNGIATTISSGGSLSEFLDKRAETLLFDYRLERERYTKSAETFMDIYISIVIAAPMIMTLLLVLIAVSGISIGLSLQSLTVVIISIVALINILFLVFLHLSQPSY
jgi:pilus assembly protein TadC